MDSVIGLFFLGFFLGLFTQVVVFGLDSVVFDKPDFLVPVVAPVFVFLVVVVVVPFLNFEHIPFTTRAIGIVFPGTLAMIINLERAFETAHLVIVLVLYHQVDILMIINVPKHR